MSSPLVNRSLDTGKASPDSSVTDMGYGYLSVSVAMLINMGCTKLDRLCDGCSGFAHRSTKVSSSLRGIINGGV